MHWTSRVSRHRLHETPTLPARGMSVRLLRSWPRRGRAAVAGAAAALLAVTVVAALPGAAEAAGLPAPEPAAPAIGQSRLVVLLCRPSDEAAVPSTPVPVRDLLHGPVDAWLRQTSQNHFTTVDAAVYGWFVLGPSSTLGFPPNLVTACKAAAAAAGVPSRPGDRVMVASTHVNGCGLGPCGPADQVMQAGSTSVRAWAQRILYRYGLDRPLAENVGPAVSGTIGAGDDWTAMSALDLAAWPGHYLPDGTQPGERGLVGYELDRLSWLDDRLTVTAGADGRTYSRYNLAPLDQKPGLNIPGPQLIRVPYSSTDPQSYFTVEYRLPYGDPNATGGRVLIHRITPATGPYHVRLLRDYSLPVATDASGRPIDLGKAPVSSIRLDGVTITSLGGVGTNVLIDVVTPVVGSTATGPLQCAPGYVWRQIDRSDHVCVTPQRKAAVDTESAWGVLCLPWTVYRRAFPSDNACVNATARSAAAADNVDAGNHVANPTA